MPITLPAFLTRHKESPVSETTAPAENGPNVLMRFLTLGGAIAIVTGSGSYGAEDCHWKCLGCDDTDNGIPRWGWNARDAANAHAGQCRAMPKPGA